MYDYDHKCWLEMRQKYENLLRKGGELLKCLEQDKLSDVLESPRLQSTEDEKRKYYESLTPKILREDWILGPGEKWLLTLHEIGESKEEAEQLEREHIQLYEKAQEILAQENELALFADRLIDLDHPLKAEVKKKREYMDEITRIFTSRVSRQREIVAMSVHFHHLVNKLTAHLDEVLENLCSEVSMKDVEECQAALETLNIKNDEINKASMIVTAEGQNLQQYLGLKESNSLGHEVTRDYFPAIIHVTQTVNALKDRKQRCNDLADVRRLKLQQMLQLFTCENDVEQAIKWIRELGETAVTQHSNFVYTLESIAAARNEYEKLAKTEQSTYEYGFHLVQVSFLLRRFCRLDMTKNKEFRTDLEKYHNLFKKILYEWMSFMDLSFAFASNVKTVNACLEDLYLQMNDLRSLPANSAEKVRSLEAIRKSLAAASVDVDKLHHVADEMINCMKQPLLISKPESSADMLAKRDESMRTVKDRMVQIERKKRVLEGFFIDGR
ncbi:unnamed protein product [Soboliphyme baturini]|uniref:Coiled-coil domain-containing protein 96 n=1 Tax=Soboliphyme baturini TaxID=241478 RepID=A0A183IC50_9BILA|nr:unnamed protein product [Soboliphyme baturini]